MNELKLKNVTFIEGHEEFMVKMTMADYLELIRKNMADNNLDGYHRMVPIAESYNNDKNITVVPMYNVIDLILFKNNDNDMKIDGSDITLYYDKLEIFDGKARTLMMKYLDKRFYQQQIVVNIHYLDIEKAKELIRVKDLM